MSTRALEFVCDNQRYRPSADSAFSSCATPAEVVKFRLLLRAARVSRLKHVAPSNSTYHARMRTEKLPHYLRTHRKRIDLSQDELAWLMGCQSGSKVSRHERSEDKPALENVLAYEIIFRLPAREIFAGIFEAVQLVVHRRVGELTRRLERANASPRMAAKLAALRLIVESDDGTHENGDDA